MVSQSRGLLPKPSPLVPVATQVWLIRNGPPKADSSTEEKLAFYKYFKQATEGDVQGSQPWAVQASTALLQDPPATWSTRMCPPQHTPVGPLPAV